MAYIRRIGQATIATIRILSASVDVPGDGFRWAQPILQIAEAKGPAVQPAFCVRSFLFIARSENKPGGTANRGEHLTPRFVVAAGNENT
jgi:hypothetical protein